MTTRMAEIGEFVEVVSGPAFKSAQFTDNPSDVPLIKGENVAQGFIAWDKSKYWPANDTEDYERFGLGPGDIVLAMDRPWVTAGLKWARLRPHDPPSLLVQRVARLRAKDELKQDFLTYVIGSAQFSDYVRNIMGGTNVPHISGAQIKAFKYRMPGEKEQAAIASILSAYDDLIENNRRRIALLEAAARLLYREWFVHFRFPGHEHVKIIDGVPVGWGQFALSDLADFVNGYAFKPAHLGDTGLPIVKIPELKQGVTEKTPRNDGELVPKKYHLTDGDLLFSWSGTLAVNVWAGGPALLNQHLFHVVPTSRVGRGFLMCAIREALIAFNNQTVGATMKHIRRSALDRVFVSLPDQIFMSPVEDTFDNIHAQLVALHKQKQKLAQARDLLLPRLMSGEIAV